MGVVGMVAMTGTTAGTRAVHCVVLSVPRGEEKLLSRKFSRSSVSSKLRLGRAGCLEPGVVLLAC